MIELLESRRLFSSVAVTPELKHVLHESVRSTFTADLGEALPLLYATQHGVVKDAATAAVHSVIHWGDGTTSAGRVVMLSDGTIKVVGTHAYAKTGRYHIVVSSSRYLSGKGPFPDVAPEFVQGYGKIRDVAEVSAAT